MKKNDYVLRISLPACNLKCTYCRRKKQTSKNLISELELLDIIEAAYRNGISRVRWTGGEPTVNKNFLNIVERVKKIGIKEQYLSTNGTIFSKMVEKLRKNGITRVNISLDTIDRSKYKKITGFDFLPNVLDSIERSVKIFEVTKINTVLTKENYEDVDSLINFVGEVQKKSESNKIAIRFIELICGGFEGDKKYVESNYLLGKDLIERIKELFGSVCKVNFEGDNPMCQYYKIKKNGVIFAIIPHYSVNFQCGGIRCKKIRLNPNGIISNCSIYKKFGYDLKNTSFNKKLFVLKKLIEEKESREEKDFKKLKHYQSDYYFWRFGT